MQEMLDDACAALIDGNPLLCSEILMKIQSNSHDQAMTAVERDACRVQLERLRGLAVAACEGIEAARGWLNELQQITGALDIYGRSGRARVETGLSSLERRY